MLEKSGLEIKELEYCSFVNWYELFEKISVKSYSLEIPENVLNYLKDDLFVLPKECEIVGHKPDPDDIVGEEGDFEDEDTEQSEVPEFQEFSKSMMKIVTKLNGSAFIKTNWHCPKDSIWITACQTLKVNDLTDIYQLLKASSICREDLNQLEEKNKNYIVFKKWQEIHPGDEFRCFVKGRNIIAISPRDWPQYHEHYKTQKQDIIKDIVSIFKEKIKDKFPIDNYCFDVVRESKDHVFLLDFSPFNEKFTNSLAFEWSQLKSDELIRPDDEIDDPEFRYLATDCGIQPNSRNNYGIPQDVIDMFKASTSSNNEAMNEEELERFNNLMINQMREEADE